MKIRHISIERIRIPLKVRFSQANNSTHQSDSVILRLETEKGTVGYGESCPRPYVTGENAQTVIQDIHSITDKLKTHQFSALNSIQTFVSKELPTQIGLSSICALELAMLDAWSKEYQTSLLEALGGNPLSQVHYSGVVPMCSPDKLEKILPILKRFEFKGLKLKIGTDLSLNVANVRKIREAYGMDMPIRVDVNTSWKYCDALEQIPVLMKYGIRSFEQVFHPSQNKEMGEITALFGINGSIMADESLTSYESACELLENKQCNHLNLKISKNGGIFNTLRIYELARKYGIPCQLGAHFGETSILTAAGLLVSSIARDLTAHEGGFGTNLLDSDITDAPLSFNQKAKIETISKQLAPWGIGVRISESLYKKFTLLAA